MRRRQKDTGSDIRSKLSASVMSYLGDFLRSGGKVEHPEDSASTRKDDQLFVWRKRETESDSPAVASTSTTPMPKLRVSNLLSKQAGDDYTVDDNGYKVPDDSTSLKDSIGKWQDFWKTPIASSLAFGALPAAIFFAASKFTSPDDTNDPAIREIANGIAQEDINKGIVPQSADHYLQAAIKRHRRNRWLRALAIGGIASAVAHSVHINPKDWSLLYKYPKIKKTASMLGTDLTKSLQDIKASIALDPFMTPQMKYDAMNVLDFAPKPVMSSTDIVNNAIYSGISGRTGLPMGRIITSAAADAAVGYGLGKLVGAHRPARMAGIFGVGSALLNALQYGMNK